MSAGVEAGPGQAMTVLVVDDDPLVLRAARRILTRAGYSVVEADTADGARAAYEEAGDALGLVLTDYSLPDADGRELARTLRERRAGLPVVLMSGWRLEQHPGDEAEPTLSKPFGREELLEVVRRALGG